jgi:hypothetical protein
VFDEAEWEFSDKQRYSPHHNPQTEAFNPLRYERDLFMNPKDCCKGIEKELTGKFRRLIECKA